MDEELNMHLGSVFTREDTSSLPVQKQSSMNQRGKGLRS